MEEKNSVEINLVDLFYFVRKRVWAIIITAIVGAVAVFVACKYFVTPQYMASTRFYVLNNLNSSSSNSGDLVYSDFQIANMLVKDYEVLITGRNVTSVVINDLNLDLTDAELAKKITVSSTGETRVLEIGVRDEDPNVAVMLANKVYDEAKEQINALMKADAFGDVYRANLEDTQIPVSPKTSRNTVIGGVLGAVAAFVVLFIIFITDDRIKTEEDVERYLKLNTVGTIPFCEELDTANIGAASKKKKKKKKKASAPVKTGAADIAK